MFRDWQKGILAHDSKVDVNIRASVEKSIRDEEKSESIQTKIIAVKKENEAPEQSAFEIKENMKKVEFLKKEQTLIKIDKEKMHLKLRYPNYDFANSEETKYSIVHS